MKPRKPISRLTKPKILRTMSRKLLRGLLEPHQIFLESNAIELPPLERKRGNYDFNKLAKALCSAQDRPEELIRALEKIGLMADPIGADLLHRVCSANEIDVPEDISDIDLSCACYINHQGFFAEALRKKQVVDTRKFRCFRAAQGVDTGSPRLSEQSLAALEADLVTWFEKKRRGQGCELVVADSTESSVWLLIIHGGTRRRTATFQNRATSVLDYHPQQDDALRLDLENGRIWIHANSPMEVEHYREVVGLHLFGDAGTFQKELSLYDLEPIRARGRIILETSDIPGCPIERIELAELCIVVDPSNGTIWKLASKNNLFDKIENGCPMPASGFIKSAKFRVKFHGQPEWVTVGISLPGDVNYESDGFGEWIERWLRARGMWLSEQELVEEFNEFVGEGDAPNSVAV